MHLAEVAQQGVVFLGIERPDGNVHFGGTGFLVHYQERGVAVPYLVTCRHVAEQLRTGFVIRVNLRGGPVAYLKVEADLWSFPHDPTVDLAVMLCALASDQYEAAYLSLDDTALAPPEEVRPGNPVNIIGLFRLHKGTSRNIPVAHTGNIAALPTERIPTKGSAGQLLEVLAYLVEAHTLDGLSGSPVWVTRFVKIPQIKTKFSSPPLIIGGVGLLGVYQASWEGIPTDLLSAERKLPDGVRVPVGMGLVVPAQEITKLLQYDPELIEQRKGYVEESLKLGVSLVEKRPKKAGASRHQN